MKTPEDNNPDPVETSAINSSAYYDAAEQKSENQPFVFDRNGEGHVDELKEQESRLEGDDKLGAIEEQVIERLRRQKDDAYEIGRLLHEGKKIVGHGKFKKWVAERFKISYSLANKLMQVFHVCLNHPEWAETFDTSIVYELCSPGCPQDLRELLFEHGDPNIRHREVKETVRRYKKGEIGIDSPEIQNLLRFENEYGEYQSNKAKINGEIKKLQTLTKQTVASSKNLFRDFQKLILTNKQAKKVEKYKSKLIAAIDGIIPEYDVNDTKPKFNPD